MTKVARQMREAFGRLGVSFDIEMHETHHRGKKDAPSGTARLIAHVLAQGGENLEPLKIIDHRLGVRSADELGISSSRGGVVFGEHEIRFLGMSEEITVTHRALQRELFVDGALTLMKWLLCQKPGFYRVLDTLELS